MAFYLFSTLPVSFGYLNLNEYFQTGFSSSSVPRSVTVVTSNTSVKEGETAGDSAQWDRRVTGLTIKFEDGSEAGVGDTEAEHHTRRSQVYDLEEGELVTEVHAHYPPALLAKKGGQYQSGIFSLTSVHDLSFVTNKVIIPYPVTVRCNTISCSRSGGWAP